jgi:hypothetical protein
MSCSDRRTAAGGLMPARGTVDIVQCKSLFLVSLKYHRCWYAAETDEGRARRAGFGPRVLCSSVGSACDTKSKSCTNSDLAKIFICLRH